MFFEDIRSERLLMRQVADRLSVRWYVGDDLDEPLPDHSTLSKLRLRYGLEVFRRFFEAIVEQCQHAKLVWGRELYFDSSAASMPMPIWIPWPRVLQWRHERLCKSTLLPCFNQKQHSLITASKRARTNCLQKHSRRRAAHLSPSCCRPRSLRHAERNSPRRIRLVMTGLRRKDGNSATCLGPTNGRRIAGISTTDPDATPMRLKGGGTHLGYHTHSVVDGGKRRIILAVLVVPGEVMDHQPMLDLLWYVLFRWRHWPNQVTGDMTYGTTENLKAIEDAHIHAYMPLAERGQRPG
jgi:Transposase domain (DUF772)/Transposase DDE domain